MIYDENMPMKVVYDAKAIDDLILNEPLRYAWLKDFRSEVPDTEKALTLDDGSDVDYSLNPHFQSCWITVENLSVYIRSTAQGLQVAVAPRGDEDGQQLGVLSIPQPETPTIQYALRDRVTKALMLDDEELGVVVKFWNSKQDALNFYSMLLVKGDQTWEVVEITNQVSYRTLSEWDTK